jgi:phosphoglycerol transferase MdoB-like AlkP superfamily enzyme
MKNDIGFYSDSILELIKLSDIILILLPFLFIISQFLIKRFIKNVKYEIFNRKFKLSLLGLIILLSSSFTLLLNQSKNEYDIFSYFKTDHFIFLTIPNTNQFTNRFGLIGLFIRDASKTAFSSFNLGNKKTINTIHTLLSSNENTFNNEFSGLYEGKNLLLIEAESLNNFAIDPTLTPTLYRLMTNGMYVDGYNSPLLFGSTSDTEFMVNTSLYPSNSGYITYHRYASNQFPTTLAKQFKEVGYETDAYHNSAGDFYNRNTMLKQLSYNFLDSNLLGLGAGETDSTTLSIVKWIIFEKTKHLSFWITYSGHQPYSLDSLNPTLLSYYDRVNKFYPELPSQEKVYIAKIMDFDASLESFIYDFERNNKLDDLVIIIYGDHKPKEIFENKQDFHQYCDTKGYEYDFCFNTPFIIWDNQNRSQVIKKTSSPLDIAPTIFDLFNINYDKSHVIGRSIFDPNYDGFYFNESGIIKTDYFTYDSINQTMISEVSTNLNDNTNLDEALNLYQNMQTLRKMVDINYFKTVTEE